MMIRSLCLVAIMGCSTVAFAPVATNVAQATLPSDVVDTSSRHVSSVGPLRMSSASTTKPQNTVMSRRRELLSRDGPYFALERRKGDIKFGATAALVTELRDEADRESIVEWLKDERSLAMSIWDEDLTTELGNSIYRLRTMNLQFVTLKLAPTVDIKMWTGLVRNDPNLPVFALQSVAFDPQVEILPGMSISPEALGIEIEVVGELRASDDGKGLTGKISFESGGKLPAPMRLLPEGVLNAATATINQTVVNFAIKSFEKGAIAKYQEHLESK